MRSSSNQTSPCVGLEEADDVLEHHRLLPLPLAPRTTSVLALLHVEVHAVEDDERPEALVEVVEANEGHG